MKSLNTLVQSRMEKMMCFYFPGTMFNKYFIVYASSKSSISTTLFLRFFFRRSFIFRGILEAYLKTSRTSTVKLFLRKKLTVTQYRNERAFVPPTGLTPDWFFNKNEDVTNNDLLWKFRKFSGKLLWWSLS